MKCCIRLGNSSTVLAQYNPEVGRQTRVFQLGLYWPTSDVFKKIIFVSHICPRFKFIIPDRGWIIDVLLLKLGNSSRDLGSNNTMGRWAQAIVRPSGLHFVHAVVFSIFSPFSLPSVIFLLFPSGEGIRLFIFRLLCPFCFCYFNFIILFPFIIKYHNIMLIIILFWLGSDRQSAFLFFSCPLYFFPYSHLSSCLIRLVLCYFIRAVPVPKCFGKYSCTSSQFPVAILNGFFLHCESNE